MTNPHHHNIAGIPAAESSRGVMSSVGCHPFIAGIPAFVPGVK